MKIALGILAAGQSKRFGSTKQMALVQSKTLLQIAVKSLQDIPDSQIFVVLGHDSETIKSSLESYNNIRFLNNKNYKSGMGTSISKLAKIASLENFDALLVHLCDTPQIDSLEIKNLITSYLNEPSSPISYRVPKGLRPPCIFPQSLFDELKAIDGDKGARSVLKTHKTRTLDLNKDWIDIDHPEDLNKLNQ